MWDTRKLLFVAIVFTALYDKATAAREFLDKPPNALDVQYNGCREKALKKFIYSGLLRQELQQSESFQKSWNKNITCSKVIPGGIKEHTTALLMYLNADRDFSTVFNNAIETYGANESTYENDFHFKSLYFLIMDSLLLLKAQQCKTVYLPLDGHFTLPTGSKGSFKGFNKGYPSYKDMIKQHDNTDITFFNITSCFFANLGKKFCADEPVILLSPAEVFTVEYVHRTETDDEDYTAIVLKNAGLQSTDNCHIFSRSPGDVSTQWLVLMLGALSLFVFNC